MVWIVTQTIAFVIVVSFQCMPVDSYWNTTIPRKCLDSQAFVYSAAGVSIFEDFWIMFLPVWELKALKLDLRKKFTLGFMFALGSLWVHLSLPMFNLLILSPQCLYHQHDSTEVHRFIWNFH
jgi:hypothetical protein